MPNRLDTRALLAFLHDLMVAALAWCGTYWLRFNLEIPTPFVEDMLRTLAWVLPLQGGIFLAFGLYRGLWRFASLTDLRRIVFAVGLAATLVPLIVVMFRVQAVIPRSVLLMDPVLLVLFMGGSRFAYRSWKEHRLYGLTAALGEPVLVLGAGACGNRLAKDLAQSREWRVVAYLDDDPVKLGRVIHNAKVFGPLDRVADCAAVFGARDAIIAMPSASRNVRRRAANLCATAGLRTLTVPSYEDLISGRTAVAKVRQFEVDDLLGRDPVVLDLSGLRDWLGGHVVLVTGPGGSIGSELCRQLARFAPARLLLLELSEYALYQIEQELRETAPELEVVCLVGDVKNRQRVAEVLRIFKPSLIFHAAAYKHVPLMEVGNAWEAVRNNAHGTAVLATEALAAGVEKLVLISTDKAVNPSSVMGASKRLAEIICQGLQGRGTQFVMVRFGNVLGSTGSVIPKFREQIARGGPITVTHPEITRYFMSIPEAAQLVLQAGLMGQGGQILVLDMGEPVRIADLARDMIRLSGADPDQIGIEFVGLRPGEKLYEELLVDAEATLPTPHPKLRVALARDADSALQPMLLAWLEQRGPIEDAQVRSGLRRWLPEYQPEPAAVPGRSAAGPAEILPLQAGSSH
ncbi:MAG: polysaccharide biosynthesis protein [Betaproteobacteria bacterium]|nr:polysaccharide biosynthesis protein [Betaproteobacteria bacterium]